jgi:1-acyl-sn-glycerol-3-phosphate acyltransferase
LGRWDKAALEIQRLVSYCLLVVFGPVIHAIYRFRFRYSAHDLASVRRRFREIRRQHPGPMLLCSNHLTLIDSIVQGVILNSLLRYLTHISALPWNLPERKNYEKSLAWRLTCYLGRCIGVTRGAASAEGRRSQEKMRYVLKRGDIISIFPEGTRSRNGRVEDVDFSYGSGQLLRMVPESTVLCVYMRGLKSGGFADFPATGERFFLDMEVIEVRSDKKGLRQTRDFSRQIIAQLKAMEDRFFASALAPGQ